MSKNPFSFGANEPSPPPTPPRGASQKPAAAPPAPAPPPPPSPTYPTLVDYFILLLGFALSVFLSRVGPLPVAAKDFVTAPAVRQVVPYLSDMMRLPEGVLLMWPIFLVVQRVRGRKQGLTSIEWLWIISWLGVAGLAALTACKNSVGLPDAVQNTMLLAPRLWYVILVPSMAAVAVVMRLLSVFSRQAAPWTHSFGLALLAWPVLPLAGILTAANFTG